MQRQGSSIWWWSSVDMFIAAAATFVYLFSAHVGVHSVSLANALGERLSMKNFLLLTLVLIFWTGVHQLVGLYTPNPPDRRRDSSFILRTLAASALGSIFFFVFPLSSREHPSDVFTPVLAFFLVASVASLAARCALWPLIPKLRTVKARPLRLIIIGSGPLAASFYASLRKLDQTYEVLGVVDLPGPHTVAGCFSETVIGQPAELDRILMTTAVDEVVIALPVRSCYDLIQTAISTCERVGVPMSYHYSVFRHSIGCPQLEVRASQPFVAWSPSRLEHLRSVKRLLDILVALFTLILFFPVMLVIAIASKLSSRGPIFFTQERYGLNKRKFRMYKFRTMVTDAEARQQALESQNEASGPVFKMKNDPRVTTLGRMLRKTSLDELPQLWNVLKGDMSLVGPRPLPNRDVARFGNSYLMRRFSVKPGLTCIWQIKGRSNTNFDQWIAYDLEYIDSWSPFLDLKILVQTIPAVLRGTGAV